MITTELRRTFPASAATTLRITAHGNVVIHYEAVDVATVEVTSCDEVDLTPVTMTVEGEEIRVDVPPLLTEAAGRRGIAIDLGFWSFSLGDARVRLTTEITLPEGADVEVEVRGSGELTVDGPAGSVVARASGGDVTLGPCGEVDIRTTSGDIRTEDVTGGTLATASGDIGVEWVSGELQIRTGSGDVRIERASGSLDAASGSGDVDVEFVDGEVITVKTASGEVRIGLPRGVPIWQDVHTVSGDVSSRLEPTGQPGEGDRFITVRVSTASGDVDLHNAS